MNLSTTLLVFVIYSLRSLSRTVGGHNQLQLHDVESGSGLEPVLDDDFAAWLTETGYNWGMKGVAISVVRKNKHDDGWVTESQGYGIADRWGTPVDDMTLFSIASNSKLFTALGIGLLTMNESIRVDWDTKIKHILPKSLWALQDTVAQEHADLVDILSHRTGLPRHDFSSSLYDTSERVVTKLRYLRPSAEFREIWQYNNHMYTLAAYIISRLTGKPFATYITRNIIDPLGMNSTTYNVTQAQSQGKLAEGFINMGRDSEKGEGRRKLRLKPVPFWNRWSKTDIEEGPGGIISNAKDMATWLKMLLLEGKSPETGDPVIPSPIIDRVAKGVTILKPKADAPELSPVVYGMGQSNYAYQGHDLIEHDGATIFGHFSVITRAPQNGVGIVILVNTDGGGPFLEMVKWRLLEKLLGLPQVDWDKRFRSQEEEAGGGNSTHDFTHLSAEIPSTLPYDDLAGTYFNPAYGTLNLCSYPPSSKNLPPRKECDGIMSEALQSTLADSPAPVLLTAWPNMWSTHLLLHHISGDKFGVTLAMEYPAPFPDLPESDDDSHPFATLTSGAIAQFSIVKRPGETIEYVEGVVCSHAWGAVPDVKPPNGEGREGAEVWFDRVV